MGTRSLLLYVICQMVITESLGGDTLPFSDVIGKVTPIKPKPFPASAPPVTKSSIVCDSKDILPKWFSPAPGTREFSSPLAFTSSSRVLPVPKIDSTSIADVKLPDRLRQKCVSSKLFNAPIRNTKPDTGTPDVSLPYKYPFLSSSTKPPNALPTYSSCDLYSSSLNKISSLSNIKSLPIVPVKPLKSSDSDVHSSASKSNNVLALPSITPLSRSRTLDSQLFLEARKPTILEQFNSNTLSPLTPCSSPYPLYYKSMFLPRVKTPEMLPLNFRPISSKVARNMDLPSQSGSRNLLNPKTLISDTSLISLPSVNGPYFSTYYSTPIKTADSPKPINTIQLPKTSPNVPVSINPVCSAQTLVTKNPWPPSESNSGSASMAFESTIKQPEFLPSTVLKDCPNPKILRKSMPYLLTDKIRDFKLQSCTPLKIEPTFGPPSNFLNFPATSLVPVSPSSPIIDVLSNKLSSAGSSKTINTPHMFPIIGASVETIEKINTHGPSCNCQSCVDSKEVPILQRINLASPCAPKLSSYQHPLFTEERVINQINYSPPIIPLEPIPTISFGSSAFSPITYLPSKISQTPSSISYINQSPSSITQCTAKMVSSINDLVSNIAQNILSSYKSYIDSAPQNIPPKPTVQINPYNSPEFILKQTLPAFPLPQGNLVNTQSILPVIIPPADCINLPVVDTSTIICSDAPCKSSTFEVTCSQPLFVCPTQPTATILPSTPLITYSPPLCPSQLPSPFLPSCPTVASPLYMEAPVFKVSSSKKDSDIEKLIELMLLAEMLNNDESFDWDDLDTLLAFLSVN